WPPKAAQVEGVNCRPPEKPLPVEVPQLPPDSHSARASQVEAGAALAGRAMAPTAVPPRIRAAAPRRTLRRTAKALVMMLPGPPALVSVPGCLRAVVYPSRCWWVSAYRCLPFRRRAVLRQHPAWCGGAPGVGLQAHRIPGGILGEADYHDSVTIFVALPLSA